MARKRRGVENRMVRPNNPADVKAVARLLEDVGDFLATTSEEVFLGLMPRSFGNIAEFADILISESSDDVVLHVSGREVKNYSYMSGGVPERRAREVGKAYRDALRGAVERRWREVGPGPIMGLDLLGKLEMRCVPLSSIDGTWSGVVWLFGPHADVLARMREHEPDFSEEEMEEMGGVWGEDPRVKNGSWVGVG